MNLKMIVRNSDVNEYELILDRVFKIAHDDTWEIFYP
jgi:hypothetical protein